MREQERWKKKRNEQIEKGGKNEERKIRARERRT